MLVWTSHILLGFSPRIESDQYEKERPYSRKSTTVSARVLSMRYRISMPLNPRSHSSTGLFVTTVRTPTRQKGHGLIIHCSIGSLRLDSRRRRHSHEEELQMGKGKTEVTAAPQYSYRNRNGRKRVKEIMFDSTIMNIDGALVPPAVYQMVGMTCSMGRNA